VGSSVTQPATAARPAVPRSQGKALARRACATAGAVGETCVRSDSAQSAGANLAGSVDVA